MKQVILFLRSTWKHQKLWLLIISTAIGLFVYGELTATRFFNDTVAEQWTPNGNSGDHNHSSPDHRNRMRYRSIHHK